MGKDKLFVNWPMGDLSYFHLFEIVWNSNFPKGNFLKTLSYSTSPQLLISTVIPVNSMHTDYVYCITWGGRSTRLEDDHVHWDKHVNNCLTTGLWCEHGVPFYHVKFLGIMHYTSAHCFITVWNNLTGKENLVIIIWRSVA